MVIRKVELDKADRLFQISPALRSFIPTERRITGKRRTAPIDLAAFRWPIAFETDSHSDSEAFRQADGADLATLREELAGWYATYYGARLDPAKEVFIGPNLSAMLMHIAIAFIDRSDLVFVPELAIPLYRRVTIACGGQPVSYAVSSRNHWLPDFDRVSSRLGRVGRLLFLNSPHNPTGAELPEKEMADLVWIASRENIAVVNDAAYATISARKPVSLLAVNGGKRVGVEIGSFSYTFGLPPLPLGFAVGSKDFIAGLEAARRLLRFPVPAYCIRLALAGIRQFPNAALKQLRGHLAASSAEAVTLMGLLGLENAGFDTVPFMWARIERRRQSTTASEQLFRKTRIKTVPGAAFGGSGDGFIRLSSTAPPDDFQAAQDRARRKLRLLKRSGKKT